MAALLAGRLPRPAYAAMLRNLHAIYTALEWGVQRPQAHAAARRVHLPALHRSDALASDLLALHGPGWSEQLPLLPAARAYAARLAVLTEAGSPLLVAHVYTRCLGDLHGGQVLQRLMRRHLGEGVATAFYDFGDSARVLSLRQQLRETLASLPVTAAEADGIVDEARWSFRQHQQLFEELPHPQVAA